VSIPVLLPNLNTEVRITRRELEAMVRPVLGDSVEALRRAVASADLTAAAVDRVLLVGGSSRMPLVAELVTEALGRPFFVDAHPKHAVALGAAISAATPAAPVPAAPLPPGPPPAATPPPPAPPPPAAPVPAPAEAAPPPLPPRGTPPSGTPAEPGAPVGEVMDESLPAAGAPAGVEGAPRRAVRGDRRRWVRLAAGGALVAVALGVAALVVLRDGDGSGGSGGPGTTDGPGGTGGPGDEVPELSLAGTTDVAGLPDGVVVDGEDVWVASTAGSAVQRLDEATGELEESIPLEGEPLGVVVAEGSVWVTQRAADTVTRLDPSSGAVQATIEVPDRPGGITTGAGAVWVTGAGETLTRIDPATGTAEVLLEGRGRIAGVAVTPAVMWVALYDDDGRVLAIDPSSGEELDAVAVGVRPDALVVAPSGVWVANRGDSTVDRIDPTDGTVTASLPVGDEPTGLVADGDDRIWVISGTGGQLELIDAASATVVARIPLGGRPLGVALSPGTVWVTLSGGAQVARVEVSPA
jgi:streptogramin lyase